jgi:hypothetical protein
LIELDDAVFQSEAELLAEKKCVAHLTGEVRHYGTQFNVVKDKFCWK